MRGRAREYERHGLPHMLLTMFRAVGIDLLP
jgi:hypothetical protein